MRYELRLTAYDALDFVVISTAIYRSNDMPVGPAELCAHWITTNQGVGETEPLEWAKDALVACIEDMPAAAGYSPGPAA